MDQNRIIEFSADKEKTEIQNLFQQIIKVLSFMPKEDEGQENLISIRYLLRKQLYIDYCAYIRSSQVGMRRCVCPVSEIELIEHVRRVNKPCFLYCHAGLVDFAFPLITSSSTVVLAGGQFLFDLPSEERQQDLLDRVKDLALDPRILREKIPSIPIIPLITIKSLIALITTIPEKFPERDVVEILSQISGSASPKYQKIQKVLTFLRNHYREQHSLEEIAEEVGFSPYYLAHIFRQELGVTVMQYRTQLRMTVAKEMLQNTKRPVTQIAFDLGWNDSNYFSLVFKNETGLSPTSFRVIAKK